MLRIFLATVKRRAAVWLLRGISPRRLALTIALGFAIGCIPMMGLPTTLCFVAALTLRLNLPVLQAANYAVMPLQLALMVPFVRLGGWLFAAGHIQAARAGALLHASPLHLLAQIGALAAQALLAWLVIALPAILLMTLTFTELLRRVPAVAAAESGD